MSSLRFHRSIFEKIRPLLRNRQISTSKKNQETVTVTETSKVAKSGNWISYGFSQTNQHDDRLSMHLILFAGVTVSLVFGLYALSYAPDVNQRDWSQREAFIELRYRERAGLPLVDPNLIDPATIVLPTDEELGDTDIII